MKEAAAEALRKYNRRPKKKCYDNLNENVVKQTNKIDKEQNKTSRETQESWKRRM